MNSIVARRELNKVLPIELVDIILKYYNNYFCDVLANYKLNYVNVCINWRDKRSDHSRILIICGRCNRHYCNENECVIEADDQNYPDDDNSYYFSNLGDTLHKYDSCDNCNYGEQHDVREDYEGFNPNDSSCYIYYPHKIESYII